MTVGLGELERKASNLPTDDQKALAQALLAGIGRLDSVQVDENWWREVEEQVRRRGVR